MFERIKAEALECYKIVIEPSRFAEGHVDVRVELLEDSGAGLCGCAWCVHEREIARRLGQLTAGDERVLRALGWRV